MHVCLRFVVRMYQAQLVILMYERDSQSQFTLYRSVSVLNKLISLGLNLTRVTRPYQVVTVTFLHYYPPLSITRTPSKRALKDLFLPFLVQFSMIFTNFGQKFIFNPPSSTTRPQL